MRTRSAIGSHRGQAAAVPAPPPPAPVTPTPLSPQASYKHVVYSPFRKPPVPLRPLGISWEAHSKYKVVRHGDSPQPLAFVHPDTVVYIVCHCAAGSRTVEDNVGDELDSQGVVARLVGDGLTIGIKRVKLYACSGGAAGLRQPSFASLLLRDMRLAGYQAVSMQAYTATVTALNILTGKKFAVEDDIVFDEGTQQYAKKKVKSPASRKRIDVLPAH